MSINIAEFEERIINSLRDSGLIEKFNLREYSKTPELSLIIEYFEKPCNIDCDDNGLFFLEDNGDKVYCPEMKTSISDKGEWLSDSLPDVNFDIDQNGNVRMADEAEALYICLQIAHILKEKSFRDELVAVAKNYDFANMKSLSNNELSFRELLKEWQSLQSVTINILVSASRFKISSQKKDTEKFLKDGIGESEAAELRKLEAEIRALNFTFSQNELAPDRVKYLTKIQRLSKIDERDDKITKLISKSPVGDLYKAMNLSSEYISAVSKKRIALWVQKEVDKLIEEKQFDYLREDRKQLIIKFTKRAYRLEKNSIRRKAVESYLSNKESFKIPSKL